MAANEVFEAATDVVEEVADKAVDNLNVTMNVKYDSKDVLKAGLLAGAGIGIARIAAEVIIYKGPTWWAKHKEKKAEKKAAKEAKKLEQSKKDDQENVEE